MFGTARVAPEKAVFRPALPIAILPGLNGTDMPKLSYSEQLKHPNWQRKRLEAMNHYGFVCARCESTDKMLHVHHRRYVKGRMAWEYSVEELNVLCEGCHSREHDLQDLLAEVTSGAEEQGYPVEVILGLVAGYLSIDLAIENELCEKVASLTGPYFVSGQIAGLFDRLPYGFLGQLARKHLHGPMNPAQEAAVAFLEEMNNADEKPEL
jgi:hypothetical protein